MTEFCRFIIQLFVPKKNKYDNETDSLTISVSFANRFRTDYLIFSTAVGLTVSHSVLPVGLMPSTGGAL